MARETEILSPCATVSEARCHCGQLMAILKKDGVELKCKRCKRLVFIPFTTFSPHEGPSPSAGGARQNGMTWFPTRDHS